VRVRCSNTGGKNFACCEAHLVYRTAAKDATQVTFAWSDDGGDKQDSRTIASPANNTASWTLPTGRNVRTRWVEFGTVAAK
jgi:hypothetical protein